MFFHNSHSFPMVYNTKYHLYISEQIIILKFCFFLTRQLNNFIKVMNFYKIIFFTVTFRLYCPKLLLSSHFPLYFPCRATNNVGIHQTLYSLKTFIVLRRRTSDNTIYSSGIRSIVYKKKTYILYIHI